MKGIKGYSRPDGKGGITVDIEAMMLDAITVMKAGGWPREMAQALFDDVWTNCKVEIDTSAVRKDS